MDKEMKVLPNIATKACIKEWQELQKKNFFAFKVKTRRTPPNISPWKFAQNLFCGARAGLI